jgi:hypothetical protein
MDQEKTDKIEVVITSPIPYFAEVGDTKEVEEYIAETWIRNGIAERVPVLEQ